MFHALNLDRHASVPAMLVCHASDSGAFITKSLARCCKVNMSCGLTFRSVYCHWQLYKTTVAIFEGRAAKTFNAAYYQQSLKGP